MKNILAKSLLLALLLALSSCMQNNGNIGPYFGLWKLTELTINGEADPAYQDNVVWKFQSGAIAMIRISDHHEAFECYGTWKEVDQKTLQVEFIYHDNSDPNGTWKYAPLPETHLPRGISPLEIIHLPDQRMQLDYHHSDGTTYGYKLEKW